MGGSTISAFFRLIHKNSEVGNTFFVYHVIVLNHTPSNSVFPVTLAQTDKAKGTMQGGHEGGFKVCRVKQA